MIWRDYHEATKHSHASLRRSPHYLDWANMPDPFRQYEGVPVLDLPAGPPPPEISTLELLRGAEGDSAAAGGPDFLSQLLFHAAAISATKRVPSTGYRYALRVNPSSGNLHPTEFHFITRGLAQWPDGLYHYRPSSHMAEQRALGRFEIAIPRKSASVVFVLTSIAWREAWKYRERAYRYCLLDIGHAWQSLALAAQAMGCEAVASGDFPDDEVARLCRFHEDEWPMLVVELSGGSLLQGGGEPGPTNWFGGEPNQLSESPISYPQIDGIHEATKVRLAQAEQSGFEESADPLGGQIVLPAPEWAAFPAKAFGEVARTRRSALDFVGGAESISMRQLSALLAAATRPLAADFAARRWVQLYLYAHRVAGLPPGVYRHWAQCAELELIRAGDQQVMAAGLSLAQDLAGNSCVTFSMVAELEGAAGRYGDRGYRYVHFEAGAIGQRLYLAAEALGLRATGIGAFFDDEVNRYLYLDTSRRQVVYHFAVGYPVPDPRLSD